MVPLRFQRALHSGCILARRRLFASGAHEQAHAQGTIVEPNVFTGEMDICFLGTSSAIPTLTRSTSCVGLRYRGDVWLFDAGEGTQRQLQSSKYRPAAINKIFISHMHGDHVFGLPGVLCSIGLSQMNQRDSPVIDIFGPQGLRSFLYTAVLSTYSTVVPRFRVHELKDVPSRSRPGPGLASAAVPRGSFLRRDDLEQSRDIYPDAKGVYTLVSAKGGGCDQGRGGLALSVQAAPMDHSIPCVGFVIKELDKPGTLQPELVSHIIERNRENLMDHFNIEHPNFVYKLLKNLKPGETLEFPDGAVVRADDVLRPPRRGRKVVIMGDTCSGEKIREIAMDADLLVHEATNAWLPGEAQVEGKYASPLELERELIGRGHSTASMAGRFAAQVRAKHLLLTHFSARFGAGNGDTEKRMMGAMQRLAATAAAAEAKGRGSAAMPPVEVTAARDFLTVSVDIEPRSGPGTEK